MPTTKIYPSPFGNLGSPTYVFDVRASTSANEVEWEEIYRLISQDAAVAKNTAQCRKMLASGDEKGYAQQKQKSGAYVACAVFDGNGRKSENVVGLTGVGFADFDHIEADKIPAALDLIKADPHTFMAYITTSGSGVRVLFRYTSEQEEVAYLDAWRWGNEYYAMLTDLPYDKNCNDVTRLSFLCHDSDCHFNPDAKPFEILTSEGVERQFATLSEETPQGEECFAVAARIADRYIPFVEGSRHNNLRYRAFLLNKMGLSEQAIADYLCTVAPRGETEAKQLAQWVAEKGTTDHGTWRGKGRYKTRRKPTIAEKYAATDNRESSTENHASSKTATPEEIRSFLLDRGLLRFNTLSATVEVWSEEDGAFVGINDRTVNSIWHDANLSLGKYVKPQDFDKELNSDAVPLFQPIEEYFASLPEWDGTDHIYRVAARIHTRPSPNPSLIGRGVGSPDDSYSSCPMREGGGEEGSDSLFAFCFRKWLVGMVSSWLDAKVLNQTILTFIGGQGLYKSTFFRMLLPPELKRYFLAKGNSTYVTKDDKLAVSSYLLIDFEEIDSMKDADLNAVKALVTTEVVSERAAYARNRENRAHLASFCATGNNRSFLTDLTGNRRWLPFEIESIDSPYDNPIDYPQLYAQAKHLVDTGYQYWFSREEDAALEAHKNTFTEPCLEEEQLMRYYRKPEKCEAGLFLTTTEIVARCSADLRGMLSTKKMGQVLKKNGFRIRGTHGKRGYIVVERTFDEIQMSRLTIANEVRAEERAAAMGRQLSLLPSEAQCHERSE